MTIKNGDFIEIEYAGKVKESGKIFDTNSSKAAKEAGVYDEKTKYEPVVICVGEGDVMQGLDEALVNKKPGKEYTIDIDPNKGFGKKNPKLVKMMSMAKFHQENIRPTPGLQLDFGNAMGTIVTVSGGRVMVDFNHPLANRNLMYEIKINRIVTGNKEKLDGFLKFYLNTEDFETGIKEDKAEIKTKIKFPDDVKGKIREKVLKRIPAIREVLFADARKEEKEKEAAETKKEEKK